MGYRLGKDEWVERCKSANSVDYDYSLVEWKNTSTPVKIICPKHGEFLKLPLLLAKGSGCPKCSGKYKPTTNEWVESVSKIHNNKYTYDKSVYKSAHKSIIVTCPIHGDFNTTPAKHKHHGCPKCSKNASKTHSDFIAEVSALHPDKDFTKTQYINSNTKVIVTCPIHGDYTTSPTSLLYGKGGCKKCQYSSLSEQFRLTYSEFVNAAIKIHGNIYEYSEQTFNNRLDVVDIKCKSHGMFTQGVGIHLNGSGCPSCNNKSKHETEIYEWIKEICPDAVQRCRDVIAPLELDIYIPSKKLAIEYNGLYWHSSGNTLGDSYHKTRHINKTMQCYDNGITLLHIFENEYIEKPDLWKSLILSKLGKTNRVYGRKCYCKVISNTDANNFVDKNHLQGSRPAAVNIGLYYSGELLSVMTFSKPRYNKSYDWEIIRMCSKQGYTIVGGASKMLNMFRSLHAGSIMSYANLRWSNGNVYEKLGFKYDKTSEPCYWYFKRKLYHRSGFMKHKLKDKLDVYDEHKTEAENMYINGYRRIWDCGNKVYSLEE